MSTVYVATTKLLWSNTLARRAVLMLAMTALLSITGFGPTPVAHAQLSCALTARPPTGTSELLSMAGEFSCNQPVTRLRVVVGNEISVKTEVSEWLPDSDGDGWSDWRGGYTEVKDWVNGEQSGTTWANQRDATELYSPMRFRTVIFAWDLGPDDSYEAKSLGSAASAWVELR